MRPRLKPSPDHAQRLERAANAVVEHRASLIVAHRLDQAARADRIIVMEAGTSKNPEPTKNSAHSEAPTKGSGRHGLRKFG